MVIIILLGVMHMFVHEFGHLIAALLVGSKIKRIGLDLRGPYVVRSPASTSWRNASVALAGSAVNLLTWAIFVACHVRHAWVALFIGCFNLLPLKHSDLTKCLAYLKRDAASVT
jgi:Zn-dependent protease